MRSFTKPPGRNEQKRPGADDVAENFLRERDLAADFRLRQQVEPPVFMAVEADGVARRGEFLDVGVGQVARLIKLGGGDEKHSLPALARNMGRTIS